MENILYPGHKCSDGKPLAGRPSISKTDDSVERVRSLVRSDRRLTLRMMSSELNLNRFSVHQTLTQDLDMSKMCAKMVPKNIATEQKANWRDACLDLLDCLERGPELFSRVITGDEAWILEYDPETKHQSREWHTANSTRPKKENEQIQNEINCHLFFWQSGDCPQGICATKTNCQSNFLSVSPWKTQQKCGTCATRHCTHVDAAPRQRPMSHGVLHQWIFGRKKHSCGSSAPLFAESQSLWLLFIPPVQKSLFGTLDNIQKSVTDELKGIPAEAFQHCY